MYNFRLYQSSALVQNNLVYPVIVSNGPDNITLSTSIYFYFQIACCLISSLHVVRFLLPSCVSAISFPDTWFLFACHIACLLFLSPTRCFSSLTNPRVYYLFSRHVVSLRLPIRVSTISFPDTLFLFSCQSTCLQNVLCCYDINACSCNISKHHISDSHRGSDLRRVNTLHNIKYLALWHV